MDSQSGMVMHFQRNKHNSEGVAILINAAYPCSIKNFEEIITGCMSSLELIIKELEIHFNINIYGPKVDDQYFCTLLEKYLLKIMIKLS